MASIFAKLFGIKDNKPNVNIQESSPIEKYTPGALVMGYISSKEAAAILGVNDSRVRQLLIAGILSGKKFGPVWLVSRASVNKYALGDRKRGPKPKKK
jgi:excisionase family DNA binding protein